MWSQVCVQSGSHSDQHTLKAVKYFLKNEDDQESNLSLQRQVWATEAAPLSHTLWATIFQLTYLKGCPGTWLQGQVGPNSSHYTSSSAMRLILPDWDGLKHRETATTSEKNPTTVPILSPTFPLAATFTLARYIRGHLLLLRHSKCWEDPEKRVRN